MEKVKLPKRSFFLVLITVLTLACILVGRTLPTPKPAPKVRGPPKTCPFHISEESITPLNGTKHFLVSAFMDQRAKGSDIRIIGMFKRDSVHPLHCRFCCAGYLSPTTPATLSEHWDHFGFPYATTDVLCQIPPNCNATHVTVLTQPEGAISPHQPWLRIGNKRTNEGEEEKFQFNFTVCISNLFGDYNNVMQFAQTLETYRLLGVNRVVIYNTSCGPDLERLLQMYSQEGFVEMVPWPIHKHLTPSKGWRISMHPGDVHYYGQLATLNECVYRSMFRSRYVMLNDIDEIIMPYQHDNLMSLMNMLQQQNPTTGVFRIENHMFPSKPFESEVRGQLPQWNGVPGFNILDRIYKVDPDRTIYHPYKMLVSPRAVVQTSVHDVLVMFGPALKVPQGVCRIINSPILYRDRPKMQSLQLDTRLWDFTDRLLPNVITALTGAGLLTV